LSPERVARAVPQIRRLLVIRWLASQGRSMISANPVLRNHVKTLLKAQKDYDPAVGALLDAQRALAKDLADPAKAANVQVTDPDADELKKQHAIVPATPASTAKIEELVKKVQSDEWALKIALAAWNAEVTKQKAAAKTLVDPKDTTASTDADVVELRRLGALPSPTPADTAAIADLVKKIGSDAWAEKAAGPRPQLTPWQELHQSVAGLKLENFKAQDDVK
ncbi:MAG TPA: hypothetical protein VEQ58_20540, partial [Polyangiaceae bacterium]|nr:hypothetical protein [Polyangiaceae bacterium]